MACDFFVVAHRVKHIIMLLERVWTFLEPTSIDHG